MLYVCLFLSLFPLPVMFSRAILTVMPIKCHIIYDHMCVESDINHNTIPDHTLIFPCPQDIVSFPCVLHFKFNAIELLRIFNKCIQKTTVVEDMNELPGFSFGLQSSHFYLILTI